MKVVPAIIEQDFVSIKQKIKIVEDLVEWVQVDVVDGLFSTEFTWERWQDLESLEGKTKIEVHLMVEQPEHYLADWSRVADRIIIHAEATEKLEMILKEYQDSPVGLGVALLADTPLEKLDPFEDRLKLVQLMGIADIGKQGQPLVGETFKRIRALRTKLPNVTIAVDGGVNLDNAKELIEAGANHLVVGSAIWRSDDVAKALTQFLQL